jgi:hypothetical protein
MALNLTQFGMTQIAGQVMDVNPTTISATIASTSNPASGYLQAGDFVLYQPSDVAQSIRVALCPSGSQADGVIIFNAKKNQYNAYDSCEIALASSIITVQAGAAFNRGALLNYVPGTVTGQLGSVFSTTSAVSNAEALDIATAAGQIVRVRVR